jgi:hypothetical protein
MNYLRFKGRGLSKFADRYESLEYSSIKDYSKKYYWEFRTKEYDQSLFNDATESVRLKYYSKLSDNFDVSTAIKNILTFLPKSLSKELRDDGADAFKGMSMESRLELLNKMMKTWADLDNLQRTWANIPNDYNDKISVEVENKFDTTNPELTSKLHEFLSDIGSDENIEPGDAGDGDDG